MFSPEREPHPSVAEIKYLQQPVALTLPAACISLVLKVPSKSTQNILPESHASSELCQCQVKVCNRYAFSDLSHLEWKWKIILEFYPDITLQGHAILVDEHLNIDCRTYISDFLDIAPPTQIGKTFLNVEGVLVSDTSWAKAGHSVVLEQFPVDLLFESLSLQKHPPNDGNRQGRLSVVEESSHIRITIDADKQSSIVIDKKTGGINAINLDERNILHGQGIQPNFTRASTDNDRGGMELVLDFLRLNWAKPLLRRVTKELFSYEMHWRDHGFSQENPPSSCCTDSKVTSMDDSIQIETKFFIRQISGKKILTCKHVYTIFTDGTMRLDVKVTPSDCIRGIPSLPRVGLSLVLNPIFHRVKYFGRGPHENYVDRKAGAHFGSWLTSPSKMGFDYIVPSEMGSRSDCRWVGFDGIDGGLVISTDSDCALFSFSALLHTAQELHTATHTNGLDQRQDGEHPVIVNIDHRLMGLGGDVR